MCILNNDGYTLSCDRSTMVKSGGLEILTFFITLQSLDIIINSKILGSNWIEYAQQTSFTSLYFFF